MFTTMGKYMAGIGFAGSLALFAVGTMLAYDPTAPVELTIGAIGTGVTLLIGSTVIGILAEISQRVEGGAT